VELDASNALSGNLYFRDISRDILNSNINRAPADATNDPSCTSNAPIDCPANNLLAHYKQQVVGSNLQWSNTDFVFDRNQITTVGLNAEFSDTSFANSGQYATLDATHGLLGTGGFMSQADIRSNNQRWGIFATNTIDATDRLSVTASARFDYASLKLSGTSCIDDALCDLTAGSGQATAVTGEHAYQRLNPSLGFTYLVAPDLTAFGNYAEGFRTPSAIELACADPAAPCSGVPNAFGADPELQAVVSKTYELGVRGNLANFMKWRTSYYRTELENDILFNQSSLTTGYFSNVGQTLRQGIEMGLDGKLGQLDYSIDLDRMEATYQSSFVVANASNSAKDNVVQAGNLIPGIPQWVFKSRFSYPVLPHTRLGLAIQSQSSQFARGDENNADVHGQVAGFTTVKLDVQHSIDKRLSLYGGVSNLFDVKYATYGALAANNITTGAAEQFQSLGAPRTVYAGLQAKF
jgi:outer membrane receptor protein involved in Fe transport